MTGSATAIYQRNLDAVSTALMSGFFESCFAHMAVPHVLQAVDGEHVAACDADMLSMLTAIRDHLRRARATHYIRLCTGAAFTAPDRIEGRHDTHALCNGHYCHTPYTIEMVLERQADGLWRVTRTIADQPTLTLPGAHKVYAPPPFAPRPAGGPLN